MIVRPKILYILRTLPIVLPGRIFRQFQTPMSKFIWQNKKSRLSLSIMYKRLHFGGMGLPDLKAYHIAVTLDQIRYWWHGSSEKQWIAMEADLAGIPNWKAALLDPVGRASYLNSYVLSIKITIRYWHSLLSSGPPKSGVSQLPIPLDFASLHILDMSLNVWNDKGILTLDALYDGSRPKAFSEVQDKYGLPTTEYLK